MWVSCVLIREQKKTMRKGTFFELDSAQRCHHLGRKNAIFVGEGYVFICLLNTPIRGVWSSLSCEKNAVFSYVYCISAIYKGCRTVCVLIDKLERITF